MSELKITITGSSGTGKTTMAAIITRALRLCGFHGITVIDDDGYSAGNSDGLFGAEYASRVSTLVQKNPELTVETAQMKRSCQKRDHWCW